MPMWRCPHCGTPQAETARCWVCRRSSTACGTCRHFRRSVAAQLGYCGLDRTRQPLTGTEIRGCWEAWPAGEASPATALTIGPAQTASGHHALEFVEVGSGAPVGTADGTAPDTTAVELAPAAVAPAGEPGWSLWGDPDR
jgi:hypothetical protein